MSDVYLKNWLPNITITLKKFKNVNVTQIEGPGYVFCQRFSNSRKKLMKVNPL